MDAEPTTVKPAGICWYFFGFLFSFSILIGLLAILFFTPESFAQGWRSIWVSESGAQSEAEDLFESATEILSAMSENRQSTITRLTGDTGVGLDSDSIRGDYYVLADIVIHLSDGRLRLVAVPRNGFYPVLHCTFRNANDFEITSPNPPVWNRRKTSPRPSTRRTRLC